MKKSWKNNPNPSMTHFEGYPADFQRMIEKDIASGQIKAGARFTVAKLGKHYGGQVDSAAAILPALVRKGLVEKIGEKAIVVCGIPEAEIESVFQFAQKSNLKPRTVVRSVTVVPADTFLAEKLALKEGAPVYQQVRTRLVDAHILANQYNFIPYAICPGLEHVDLSRRSFQVTLEEDYHTVIKRIEETYSLEQPARDDAEILGLPEKENVLVVERMSYSASDMPLVFADIHVNPFQFHYVKALWPEAADLVQGK